MMMYVRGCGPMTRGYRGGRSTQGIAVVSTWKGKSCIRMGWIQEVEIPNSGVAD